MDATGFWDHLPVMFTVPKLVVCVDFAWIAVCCFVEFV